MNQLQAFGSAMVDKRLGCPDRLIDDGDLHRYHVEGDRRGSRNGWYVLHAGSTPAGAYGSWRTGESFKWCARSLNQLSDTEQAEYRRKLDHLRNRRNAELERRHEQAADKAGRLWRAAKPADPHHQYLASKRVRPHCLRQLNTSLVLPLYDGSKLVNAQLINAQGNKRFLCGGRVSGCYSTLGHLSDKLYISEGFATAATVHELTGCAVAIALNAGNLKPVALHLRRRHPNLAIIVAADNDRHTAGNPGRSKGIEAAQAVDGMITWPEFPESAQGSDFNDLVNLGVVA